MNRPSHTFEEWMAMLLATGMDGEAAQFRADGFATGRLWPYRFARAPGDVGDADVSWDGIAWEKYVRGRHFRVDR